MPADVAVRVVDLPCGLTEQRLVRLGPGEQPRLHALQRRVEWLAQRIEALRTARPAPAPPSEEC
jgi:hypothetical protein